MLGKIVAFFMLSVDETFFDDFFIFFICTKTMILRLLRFNQAIVQATYLSVFDQAIKETGNKWLVAVDWYAGFGTRFSGFLCVACYCWVFIIL